jgi:hypothetical protein
MAPSILHALPTRLSTLLAEPTPHQIVLVTDVLMLSAVPNTQKILGEAFFRFIWEGKNLCTKLPIACRSMKALKRAKRFTRNWPRQAVSR